MNGSLAVSVRALEDENTRLKRELADAEAEIAQFRVEYDAETGENKDVLLMETKLRTLEEELRAIQGSYARILATSRNHAARAVELTAEITARDAGLEIANDEVVHWKRVAHSAQNLQDKLQAQIRSMQQRLGAKEDEMATLSAANERLHSLRTQLSAATAAKRTHELLVKWRDAETHRASDAAKLGEWHTYAMSTAISVVLSNILRGEEPKSK